MSAGRVVCCYWYTINLVPIPSGLSSYRGRFFHHYIIYNGSVNWCWQAKSGLFLLWRFYLRSSVVIEIFSFKKVGITNPQITHPDRKHPFYLIKYFISEIVPTWVTYWSIFRTYSPVYDPRSLFACKQKHNRNTYASMTRIHKTVHVRSQLCLRKTPPLWFNKNKEQY